MTVDEAHMQKVQLKADNAAAADRTSDLPQKGYCACTQPTLQQTNADGSLIREDVSVALFCMEFQRCAPVMSRPSMPAGGTIRKGSWNHSTEGQEMLYSICFSCISLTISVHISLRSF